MYCRTINTVVKDSLAFVPHRRGECASDVEPKYTVEDPQDGIPDWEVVLCHRPIKRTEPREHDHVGEGCEKDEVPKQSDP